MKKKIEVQKFPRGKTLTFKDPNGILKLDLTRWRIVRFEIEPIINVEKRVKSPSSPRPK